MKGLPTEFKGLVIDEDAAERFNRMDRRTRQAIIKGARGLSRQELMEYLKQRLEP